MCLRCEAALETRRGDETLFFRADTRRRGFRLATVAERRLDEWRAGPRRAAAGDGDIASVLKISTAIIPATARRNLRPSRPARIND